MNEVLPPELSGLPKPRLIEEIDYEARLAMFIANAVNVFAARGIAFDVDTLETDPAIVLLEHSTFEDTLLRQAINEGVRSQLLPFAIGGDIDNLAAFYDVARLTDETDAALRKRVVLAIRGRSTGGTEPRYKAVALSASSRVADVAVYTEGRNPTIRIAVFSTDNAGVADAALLAAVNSAVQAADVRMVNDVIVVAAAAQLPTPITAQVWLLPQTSDAIIADMRAKLTAAWAEAMSLGRDVTHSWLQASLFIEGVQRIEITAPVGDIVIADNKAAALGEITLTNMGRDY